jgi:IMP and pyridine-specific 5'-nucleotidase
MIRPATNLLYLDLMSRNTKIGIVTAAGYTEASRYYERLHGLLDAVRDSALLTLEQKNNLIVMGKYCFSWPPHYSNNL